MPYLRYFWFLSAAFWAIVVFGFRVPRLVDGWSDRPTEAEIALFRKRVAMALCGPQLALGVIVVLGQLPFPPTITPLDLSNPWVLAYWLLPVALQLVLVWWVWARDGASYLARFAPAINPRLDARKIKLLITLLAGAAVVFNALLFAGVLPDPTA